MTPELVLIGGGVLSALLGLVGIYLTQRENTPITDLLNAEELRSYRTQVLMTEGISFCTLGKHEFRPMPGSSQTACPECLPPVPVARGKWEPHTEPAHPTQRLNFGRAYTPVSAWWPELYEKEDES